jgi:hypothetical protein
MENKTVALTTELWKTTLRLAPEMKYIDLTAFAKEPPNITSIYKLH